MADSEEAPPGTCPLAWAAGKYTETLYGGSWHTSPASRAAHQCLTEGLRKANAKTKLGKESTQETLQYLKPKAMEASRAAMSALVHTAGGALLKKQKRSLLRARLKKGRRMATAPPMPVYLHHLPPEQRQQQWEYRQAAQRSYDNYLRSSRGIHRLAREGILDTFHNRRLWGHGLQGGAGHSLYNDDDDVSSSEDGSDSEDSSETDEEEEEARRIRYELNHPDEAAASAPAGAASASSAATASTGDRSLPGNGPSLEGGALLPVQSAAAYQSTGNVGQRVDPRPDGIYRAGARKIAPALKATSTVESDRRGQTDAERALARALGAAPLPFPMPQGSQNELENMTPSPAEFPQVTIFNYGGAVDRQLQSTALPALDRDRPGGGSFGPPVSAGGKRRRV